MPKLVAKERFYYDGRNIEAGEEFDAQDQDVSLLTHSVSPRAAVPAPKRQQTRSKVLKAETVESAPATTTPTDDLLHQQASRYHRSDMRAED